MNNETYDENNPINSLSSFRMFCFADDMNDAYSQQTSSNTQQLVQYLKNLGSYLGYDLSQDPNSSGQTVNSH